MSYKEIKILSLNVNGLGNPAKRAKVVWFGLVSENHISVHIPTHAKEG